MISLGLKVSGSLQAKVRSEQFCLCDQYSRQMLANVLPTPPAAVKG